MIHLIDQILNKKYNYQMEGFLMYHFDANLID